MIDNEEHLGGCRHAVMPKGSQKSLTCGLRTSMAFIHHFTLHAIQCLCVFLAGVFVFGVLV
jgi:hypothetical protein